MIYFRAEPSRAFRQLGSARLENFPSSIIFRAFDRKLVWLEYWKYLLDNNIYEARHGSARRQYKLFFKSPKRQSVLGFVAELHSFAVKNMKNIDIYVHQPQQLS